MFGLGVVVAVLLGRFQLPTVAGLLLAGALAGPSGLALVRDSQYIETLAEVGVVLLLFTVGLEFSLVRLRVIAKLLLLGGSLQAGLTIGGVALVAAALGLPWPHGIFLGFLFTLSSTAIVLRALSDRGETDAPHGRVVLGVLVFQDLLVVPMMLLVPVLAGHGGPVLTTIALAVAKAALVVVVLLGVVRRALPWILTWVDRRKSRDLFVLAIVATCLGTAYLTSQASLSLALGAFLSGMALADTEYGPRALGEMMPLRDVFSSLFFLSMGMLFDIRVLIEDPLTICVLVMGLVLGKGFLVTVAALAMRFPARVAWLAGVGLAQFGEFGFVLALSGQRAGLIDANSVRQLFAAGAISMFITPILMRVAPHVSAGERLLRPLERLLGARGIDEPAPEHIRLSNHVVIGGYGTAGRMLAAALGDCGTKVVALDLDIDRVRAARTAGEPVYYGDVTSTEALGHARLAHARVMALVINDPDATRRAVTAARALAPHVPLIVRTPGAADADLLRSLGADNVVREKVESGLEMMARVLRRTGLPGNLIAEAMRRARTGSPASERKPTLPRQRKGDIDDLADLKVESVLLRPEAHAIGRSLSDLELRRRTGALVVAVRHKGRLRDQPDPTAPLMAGDTLFLAGAGPSIRRAIQILENGAPGSPTFPTGIDVSPPPSED